LRFMRGVEALIARFGVAALARKHEVVHVGLLVRGVGHNQF
jgi:hypothetical protein